ncbi:hypothetical protein B5S28_g1855 [[Candida] boidinii]|nr:hypothetical protein B5S28_g1855 [[Candida] boidinii]OWB59657.1 hypothetical protein B5S29_g518 [[Candida] boidinii]OWB71504.1 hypothetical protein B5S31_g1193 [[Candida] boidinii]
MSEKTNSGNSFVNNIRVHVRKISKFIDSLGGESRGIQRVYDNEKSNSLMSIISIMGLWMSGCSGLTSMSSFFLGPLLFGLGYRDTILIGFFALFLGCLFAAYCSVMGRSGLRQMTSARFLFGPIWIRIVSIITIIGFCGWSITNNVLGGEILRAVSNEKVPLEVGIIIISVVSLIVSIFGINYVLKFEAIISIPVVIVVFLLYIIAGPEVSKFTHLESVGDSMTINGNRLNFFALCYSVTATWGGCASDYMVYSNLSQKQLFTLTFFSIIIPTTFGAIIGMLIGNAAIGNEEWFNIYEEQSLGGLLNLVFSRWNGFGKFLLIVLWLSLITNNIINTYSSALSFQLIDNFCFKYLPRWFITIIIFAIVLICSLVGKNKFGVILSNFLPMLGYWISIYITILFVENVVFRSSKSFINKMYIKEFPDGVDGYFEYLKENDESFKNEKINSNNDDVESNGLKSDETGVISTKPADSSSSIELSDSVSDLQIPVTGSIGFKEPIFYNSKLQSAPYYNFEIWNHMSKQTYGIAATISFFSGVAGCCLGMNQVYYIAPLAKKIGDYGGDLGMWLAIGFTGVAYLPLRYLELKYFGK